MGAPRISCQQLAAVSLGIAHGRLSTIWPETRGTSSRQCGVPFGEHLVAFPCAAADDRRLRPKRLCSRPFCFTPAACRIRCVDFRTQGCAERVLFSADNWGLWTLRGVQNHAFIRLRRGKPTSKVQSLHPPSSILYPLSFCSSIL